MIHSYQLNGYSIVLDVHSGAVHVVDELTYQMIGHISEQEAAAGRFPSPRALQEALPQASLADITQVLLEIQELAKQGLLYTPATTGLLAEFQGGGVVKALCLHMAHDCNLSCRYCFASQGNFGGEKSLMSFEVGKKALDYLLEHSGARRNLEVDFFGGEPLMNFAVLKQLVAYGNQEAPKKGKQFRFTVTTNGILLDDEKIDYLNAHMHNVVLSLDGRPEVNDRMRPTPNGKGSYDLIVPRFQKLIEGRGDQFYYVRGTFTRDNLDFSQDVLHMKELGFDMTSMEPVVDASYNPYALTEQDLPAILNEYETFAKQYAGFLQEKEPFRFFHYMIDLTQGPCVVKRLRGCGAGNEYLAVTPSGDLYPCHQFAGQEEYRMGNILDPDLSLPSDLQALFANAHVDAKEDCQQCWARYYCSGGCHANALHFNNDIRKPYQMGCQMQRKRVECAIMTQAALHSACGGND